MNGKLISFLRLLCAVLLFVAGRAAAQTVGNAFHVPDSTEISGGLHMRNPEFEIGTSTTVTILQRQPVPGQRQPRQPDRRHALLQGGQRGDLVQRRARLRQHERQQ